MDERPKPRSPARITVREYASQTGLDDFDEDVRTNVAAKRRLDVDEPTLDDPHEKLRAGAQVGFPAGLEVAIVEEHAVSARPGQWRAVEVWTANRVYAIDGNMTCFGVMERASGQVDERHTFLGARLMGGEVRDAGSMKMTHPLPVPGTEAVFQVKSGTKGRYGRTSKVERVVLRIRATLAIIDNPEAMWEDITTMFKRPG
jgi:hypothetical protein